jgi:cobalt-zinc-cadmium efflux system membrane fusion protein
MKFEKKSWVVGGMVAVGLGVASVAYSFRGAPSPQTEPRPVQVSHPAQTEPAKGQSLELKPEEFKQFKVEPAGERTFILQREAVGNIDFNQEMSMDVFPPVQGKILKLFASAGDDVEAGAPLYTLDSPDLVQAGSTLISAAGVLDLTTRALKRAKELHEVQGVAQKDLDQATSDQQAAEAAFKAARDAVRIFGKTDQDMDRIVAERKIDPALVVRSPISGRVTARTAAPGQLAQPGNPPAPYTLSDVSTLWMLADVAENDFAVIRLGLPITVAVKAYPNRRFDGKIVNIGASVDPSTRRVTVRSLVADPKHELRAGMFATFVITIGEVRSLALPRNGVIREGDGTMSVWIATDSKTMVRRTVTAGLEQEGFVQILDGLKAGEPAATEASLFLSSAILGTPK